MNEAVSSYATIRKKVRNENISFCNFCSKIIDMLYARKRIKHRLSVQTGISSSRLTVYGGISAAPSYRRKQSPSS
jgi:hypothetical protein